MRAAPPARFISSFSFESTERRNYQLSRNTCEPSSLPQILQVFLWTNTIFFRRNNYPDDIDVISQTNKLSHWINDWMDDSRHYMAGWCANIILTTTSTHGTYITSAVNTICTRGYLTNNEYNVHARLLPTRLSYAWSRSPGRRRRHFVRTSVDDDDDGM